MKYENWLYDWLNTYIVSTVKKKTYLRYTEIVNQHVIPKLGSYNIDELNVLIIQKYITQLLKNGNLRTGGGLAPNSVNSIINVIKCSLGTAYRIGLCNEYVMDKIKRPKIVEKQVMCFTTIEQKQIENEIFRIKRDKLFGIILCLYTGLRIGELLALKWTDVNFTKLELSISKTCYDGKNDIGLFCKVIDEPKTISSNRLIPFPKQLLVYFKEIKKRSKSIYVISNGEKDISIRSYQKTFASLLNRLDIEHRGFHSLRHTFATRALECGMDVKTLSEILGHKNPSITLNRYVHSMMEHKKFMMNKLGKLL